MLLDTYSVGMDPAIVPNPDAFEPERFLPDAVQARVGTPAQVLDHAFYKAAFSQGARKCPGSRVASYEVLVLMAQLILDWKISIDRDSNKHIKHIQSWRDIPYSLGIIIPEVPAMKFERRRFERNYRESGGFL